MNITFGKKQDFYVCMENDTYNRLIGKIMEITECLGLPEKQESSIKTQIKEQFYTIRNDISFNLTREQIEQGYKIPKI